MIKKITKKIRHKEYEEYFVTLNWHSFRKKDIVDAVNELSKKNVKIISVIYTGSLKKFVSVSSFLNPYPFCALGDSSSDKSRKDGGIYIYGIRGEACQIRYIKIGTKTKGAYFRLPGCSTGLYFDASPSNICDKTFEKETVEEYKVVDKILSKFHFSAKDAFRFWIYMRDIYKNYPSFNRLRDKYFKKNEIKDYPASTGIEAGIEKGRKILISLEAMKNLAEEEISLKTIKSELQCDAMEYGPKFSRGKIIDYKKERIKKIYVSGTSSVDGKGLSTLTINSKKNIEYVLFCVQHLLNMYEADLEDIVMSRIYFKNKKIKEIFKKIFREKKMGFPYNYILTNVCREDFLFEIECVAAKKY